MKTPLLTIVALSGVMAFSSAPAGADSKTFPGAFCHADGPAFTVNDPNVGGPIRPGFAFPQTAGNGGLFNAIPRDAPFGNVTNFYSCPIVRDITRAQPDGINFARMHVNDNNPSGDIQCVLFSRTKTSPTAASTAVDFAIDSSSGTGNQQLDYPALDAALRGYYTFVCAIPGVNSQGVSSGILCYDVSEKD